MNIKNLTVEEYTSPSPHYVKVDSSLSEVMELFKNEGIRHMPVMDHTDIVGVISQRDFNFDFLVNSESEILAKHIMTVDPYIVMPNTPLDEVAFQMSVRKIGSAIVRDGDNDLYGIFTSTDALNALIEVVRGDTD